MICGVGCDICKISRFKKNPIEKAQRILTKQELMLFNSYGEKRQIEFLAGRFALKEAIIKAIDRTIFFQDIDIGKESNGKAICKIDGYKLHLSLSHEEEYAVAYVICEKVE